MNNKEFSDRFDVLYNNITSNQAPGLNDYEKSIFLTKAQEELLKSSYYPAHNAKQEGYDDTVRRQLMYENLVSSDSYDVTYIGRYPNSRVVKKTTGGNPDDGKVLFIIDELVIIKSEDLTKIEKYLTVFPIHYMEYQRLTSKPLKEPMRGHVWKLITGDNKFDLIFTTEDFDNTEYKVEAGEPMARAEYIRKYIKKPNPIILSADIALENMTIDGESNESPCELDATFHEEILQRAVEIAKNVWQGSLESTIQLGQRDN